MEENQTGTSIELASRWSRAWAAFIDGLISIAFLALLLFNTEFGSDLLGAEGFTATGTILVSLYSWSMFILANGYLLSKYGQTIGKNVFEIAIVSTDYTKMGFWEIILKRYLAIGVLSSIPLIGGIFSLANILFIFRKDRRCIHDHFAGTLVVNVSASTSHESEKSEAKLEA